MTNIKKISQGRIYMFEWKDQYSVRIDKLDQQHKKLLEIGRKLVDILENTCEEIDQFDQIRNSLKEMFEYATYHFSFEEKLMEKYDFIDLASHRFQHKMFIKKIEEFDLDELDDQQREITLALLDFISQWITEHILKTDHKYSNFLIEKGV